MPTSMKNLTAADWLNVANMGTSLVGGLASGKQDARRADETAAEFALRQQQELYRQVQDAYARRLSARSGIGAALQDQLLTRQTANQSTLNAMPLGAEQSLAMQMARARGLSTAAENFKPITPSDPRIAGAVRSNPNILSAFTGADYRAAISPEATARSIAERRKAIAGVNPDFSFGNMGDYGLPNLGGEVDAYKAFQQTERSGRENQLMQLLTQQMADASKPIYTPDQNVASATNAEPKKEGTPWWKKVLKVAAVAAPIVAAPFTGGASLALIGAGAGAASGALNGGGLKGAILGGAMGAIPMGGAGSHVAGSSALKSIGSSLARPSSLMQLGGAAIGGGAGAAVSGAGRVASNFGQPQTPAWQGAPYAGPIEGAQAQIPGAASYIDDILKQAAVSGQFVPQQPTRQATQYPAGATGMIMGAAPQQAQVRPSGSNPFTTGQPQNPNQFNFGPPSGMQFSGSPAQAAPAGMSPMSPVPSHGPAMTPMTPVTSSVRSAVLPQPAAPTQQPQTMSDMAMFMQNLRSRNGNINLPSGPAPAAPVASGSSFPGLADIQRGGQQADAALIQMIQKLVQQKQLTPGQAMQFLQSIPQGFKAAGKEFVRSSPFGGQR